MQKACFSFHGNRRVRRGPSLTKACASREAPRLGAFRQLEVPGTGGTPFSLQWDQWRGWGAGWSLVMRGLCVWGEMCLGCKGQACSWVRGPGPLTPGGFESLGGFSLLLR